MTRFFGWLRRLFSGRKSFEGWQAIDQAKVDSPEDWRNMNNS